VLNKISLRGFLILWVIAWGGLVCALWVYWHSMPKFISWPLAFLEALLVPNVGVVKKYVLKNEPLKTERKE